MQSLYNGSETDIKGKAEKFLSIHSLETTQIQIHYKAKLRQNRRKN